MVTIKDSSVTPEYELEKFNIVYNKETKKFEREDGKELIPEVANVKFLFQMLDVKNNPLKNWQIERATKIRNTDSYTTTYTIENKKIAEYLGIDSSMRIDLDGNNRDKDIGSIGTWQIWSNEKSILESVIIKED